MGNGNEKLNESRDTVNKNVKKYRYLGKGLAKELAGKRRFRSI